MLLIEIKLLVEMIADDQHFGVGRISIFDSRDMDVPMTIPEGGVHVVRLVCSGKNTTSTNYTLAADWITICPV